MTAHIERHNPDGVWKGRTALYNHCVRVTNATTTLYIAGQLARSTPRIRAARSAAA